MSAASSTLRLASSASAEPIDRLGMSASASMLCNSAGANRSSRLSGFPVVNLIANRFCYILDAIKHLRACSLATLVAAAPAPPVAAPAAISGPIEARMPAAGAAAASGVPRR